MRTVFVVLAPPGESPTAMSFHMPVNQRLSQVVETMLTLRRTAEPGLDYGSADSYGLHDLYQQPIDPGILVCQVPFPGCVIATFKEGKVKVGDRVLTGAEAAETVVRSIAMSLIAQRKDDDDKMSLRYSRFIEAGGWRFTPTPITSYDLALTYHERDAAAATQLLEMLGARKLRCRTRCVNPSPGDSSSSGETSQPTDDVRALAVMVSPETRNEAWMAYDVGGAWARGIPVVPILVGEWKVDVPNILAPYQQVHWNTQQERIVDQLVAMLDLTPWEMPVQEAEEAVGEIRPEARKKSNGKRPAGGRKNTANRTRG